MYHNNQQFVQLLLLQNAIIEPMHEKINNLAFRPGLTQTGPYSHRSRLEA